MMHPAIPFWGWAGITHAGALEDHGRVNFLKGGIAFADMVNTVSPTYANGTVTPELGYGMAPMLNDKGDDCGHY